MPYKQQDNGLTVREDRFAICIAVGMEQVQAYLKCFQRRGRSDNAIAIAASRLAARPTVVERAESCLAEAKAGDLDSIGQYWADLKSYIKAAASEANWTAVAALMRLRGQVIGALVETIAVRAEQSMTDETLVKQLSKGDQAKAATLIALLGGKKAA